MAANGSASTALPAPNSSTASTVSPPAGWEITPYNQQSTWEIIPYFPVPDRRTTMKEFYYTPHGDPVVISRPDPSRLDALQAMPAVKQEEGVAASSPLN